MRADVETAVRKAADAHGIEAAALLAVVDIESAGAPFEIADGTTPQFLFERHIFYQQLHARAPGKLNEAITDGLANASWQPATQYKDQGTSKGRLALLGRAVAVDADCAYRAASWGVGQTMGFQAEHLGYDSASSMVNAMRGNIDAQIEAMVGEIKYSKIDDDLAAHRWAAFAKGYNGAGYRRNRYDEKLAASYAKWSQGENLAPEPSAEIKAVQESLNKLGFNLTVDGFDGPQTQTAVMTFQQEHNLTVDGIAGPNTLAALKQALSPLSPVKPEVSMLARLLLTFLGNAQIQSLVRSALKMVGTGLLIKFGLDAPTANSVLAPILDAVGGIVSAGAGLYLSAQAASENISNPTLISPTPQAA
jgi:hypothetical protein